MARPEEQHKSSVPVQIPDLKIPYKDGGMNVARRGDANPRIGFENFRSPGVGIFINKECWDRIRKLRDRTLVATVPAKLLRKGRNVLAVEIRGSQYHPGIVAGNRDNLQHWVGNVLRNAPANGWSHAELLTLELRDPSGVIPSATEPPKGGLQVWAEDMHMRVLNVYARPAAASVGTVRMVGALNGNYSGMAVVRSSSEITGLKATASELKSIRGVGSIPSSCISVVGMQARPLQDLDQLDAGGRGGGISQAYMGAAGNQASFSPTMPKRGKFEDRAAWLNKVRAGTVFYDQISSSVPDRVPQDTAQPLWISLKIPMETEPGIYKGVLTVSAQGSETVTVPVEAEVIGWRVPNPQEFKTDVWLEEHPYAIASHYLLPPKAEAKPGTPNWEGPVKAKVPLWSDEHFNLLEASFRQLGRVGNDFLHIPVLSRTEFGNWQDSMIKWIRKKPSAASTSSGQDTFEFDYTVLDRYLDLVMKYLGRVRVVDFVIMHSQLSSPSSCVMVTDEASGKIEELDMGWRADSSTRLPVWKQFASSLLRHMRERYPDSRVYWGHAGDYEPDPMLMSYLSEIFPNTFFSASGHCYSGGAGGGGHSRNVIRCFSDIYGLPASYKSALGWKGAARGKVARNQYGAPTAQTQSIEDVGEISHKSMDMSDYSADESRLFVQNPRDVCNGARLPISWRTLTARSMRMGYSGVGRIGFDAFNYDWQSGSKNMDYLFPGRSCNMLVWPGRNGAESSARLEAFLEGIQETEASLWNRRWTGVSWVKHSPGRRRRRWMTTSGLS